MLKAAQKISRVSQQQYKFYLFYNNLLLFVVNLYLIQLVIIFIVNKHKWNLYKCRIHYTTPESYCQK